MGILQARIWSGLPCTRPGNLPNPGIAPRFPTFQASYLPTEPPGKPRNTGVGIPSPDPEIEPGSPELQADSLPDELPGKP